MEKAGTDRLIKIVITGPESTGKTTLCEKLSAHYHTVFIPEFARDYVSRLGRRYTYEDVVYIAEKQIELEEEYTPKANRILFYDTYLDITKVWLDVVFKKYPPWMDKKMKEAGIDLFLLCYPDIPWIPDEVRENGGPMREILFNRYKEEIMGTKSGYFVVKGEERLKSAIKSIERCLQNRTINSN